MKNSRESGADTKKKRAEVIQEEHEEALWNQQILGKKDPRQLLHTLLFLFGKNFALRGREEHRNLSVKNISKHFNHLLKRHYLEYTETLSKTRKGGIKDARADPKNSKAYDNPNNPDRCIVALYDLYMSHRPDHVDAFYLTPIESPRTQEWYKAIPLGVNTISNVVKNLLQKAGIKGHFTNHSLKRTSRSVLCNSGFGRDVVMKKTGHTSNSELDYLEMDDKMESEISDSINFCKRQRPCPSNIVNNTSNVDVSINQNVNITTDGAQSSRQPTLIIEKEGIKVHLYI